MEYGAILRGVAMSVSMATPKKDRLEVDFWLALVIENTLRVRFRLSSSRWLIFHRISMKFRSCTQNGSKMIIWGSWKLCPPLKVSQHSFQNGGSGISVGLAEMADKCPPSISKRRRLLPFSRYWGVFDRVFCTWFIDIVSIFKTRPYLRQSVAY